MDTTTNVSRGRRKRKPDQQTVATSGGSNKQKGTKKRKKQVEEGSAGASINTKGESLPSFTTAAMDTISEVKFKKKPVSVIVSEVASYNEPGPSGVHQVTSSQDGHQPLLSRGEERDRTDKDISVEEGSSQQPSHSKGNIKQTRKDKSVLCPKCGKGFTSKKRLIQNHYDEETQTCKSEQEGEKKHLCRDYSNDVNTALATRKISEEELYAVLTEDMTSSERNAVWRRILKLFKILKCQNENCNHRVHSISAMRYHADRCGKVVEKLTCPVCNNCYTSKPGLYYHMTTQHQRQEQPQQSPELHAELTVSKRQAAVKAAVNISKVSSTDEPSDDIQQTVTDEQSNSPGAIEHCISKTEWATIRNAIKNDQEVKCPSAHCSLTFKSISGFRYHISKCKENKTLTCSLCKKHLTTWQRFQNHMLKIHNIGEQDCLDYEYTEEATTAAASEDDDDDGGDGEGEKKQKTHSQTQSKKTSYRSTSSLVAAYQQQLKKLVEELTSREQLFTDWQPSLQSWTRCDPRECAQYAPVARQSMRFCFADSKNGTSPVSQLTLFDAALEDEKYGITSGVIFNVGGPVWSMAWAPSGEEPPSDVQYVAMAAYRTPDETYRMDIPIKHNGLIQLWSVTIGDQPQLAQLSLGIAHNYGCIRSMKWCPSGGMAKLTPTIDNSEMLSRLGLLALACTDAVVRILSIPYPDILLERLDPIKQQNDDFYNVFVIPKSICCLLSPSNITSQSDFSTLYGQCMDVEWLPRQPHNKIAASFSNGTVAIWDLLTTSWLLRGSHDCCDAVFYPQQHISTAHFGNVCRTISWCPDDPDYLFTAGYDRRLCLWDLKHPDEPVDKWDRGWCLDSKWPLLCPGVFCLEDCTSRSDTHVRNLSFQEFWTGKPSSIIRSFTPQISFSYCHWRSTIAFGTINGDVTFKRLLPFIYLYRRPKCIKPDSQILCFSARLSDVQEGDQMTMNDNDSPSSSSSSTGNKCLTFYNFPQQKEHQLEYRPDVDPVTAITKVAWNPHHQYCDWLLVATNTGLVRLLKLSS